MDAFAAQEISRAFLHGFSAGAAFAVVAIFGVQLLVSRFRGDR